MRGAWQPGATHSNACSKPGMHMVRSVRFGVLVLPEFRWSTARDLWRRVEELGFDHAWTYDHLAWRSLRDSTWYGAVPFLAAGAVVTERIRLGTLVASPNFRHPVPFARELVTLDDLSNGRLTLGIGAGARIVLGISWRCCDSTKLRGPAAYALGCVRTRWAPRTDTARRQRDYADTVMVTTLSPCWYCSGLVRQFGIGAVVMGESENFSGGHAWLAENGVEVVDLADAECIELLGAFISSHHDLWFEDIGL